MWLFALVYFFPTIWALYKKHPNKGTILAFNVFFGWTPVWFLLVYVANSVAAKIEPVEIKQPPDFKCRYAAAIRDEISNRLGEHRHDDQDYDDAETI